MTKIRYRINPVWHETNLVDSQSGRPFCVAERPSHLLIRLKGTRTVVSLPWNIALDSVLQAQGLGVQVNGNILRVADAKTLADEGEVQAGDPRQRFRLAVRRRREAVGVV